MNNTHQTITTTLLEIIAEVANVDYSEISLTDHLEDDIMMSIDTDLPRIIARVNQELQELDVFVSSESLKEFIKEIHADPDKGTVTELASFIEDEMEF